MPWLSHNFTEALVPIFGKRHAADVACPECGSLGGVRREVIVVPQSDGTERPAGYGYGCPRCAMLYGIVAGVVFRYGDKRDARIAPTQPAKPDAASADPSPSEDQRRRSRLADPDMPWNRR